MASRALLHDYQLESYQLPGYFRTLKRTWERAVRPGLCLALCQLIPCLLFFAAGATAWLAVIALLCPLTAGFLIMRKLRARKAKKPFGITARVKRLMGASAFVHALLGILMLLLAPPALRAIMFTALPAFLPLTTALAGLAALPVEKGISEMYFRDAQRILKARPDLIRVGITGSYGKTSVKFILGTLLSEHYQTLITPSSFNTPMGVTKVIRTRLTPSHEVFVAEMGARHVGDIRELCRLVHPRIGVLTSVGPQHLVTFRTIERIRDTKYELVEALPQDGTAVFSDDDGICLELYEKTQKEKTLTGLHSQRDDVWAEDITVSPRGSRFTLCTREARVACETPLLGEHNIKNILLAAAVCLRLQMTLPEIARGIGKLRSVEHRLELRSMAGGVTMIDDAFNSNPAGSRAALDVIAAFPPHRLIVTPGMVELGNEEKQFNRAFGEHMAQCVDTAILVGPKHTAPIREGLLAKGFPENAIYTVKSLEEATAQLHKLLHRGDTVLFENDLPDNYSEE